MLSRAAIVIELTRRLLDVTERAQLTTHIKTLISQLKVTVMPGTTDDLMNTEFYVGELPFTVVNEKWTRSLKEDTFEGADDSTVRAVYLLYHSTLLITKFVHVFCHVLTHWLIEWIWTMDMSAHRVVATSLL